MVTKITEPLDDSWLREPGRSATFQAWLDSLGPQHKMRKVKGRAGQFTYYQNRKPK